MIKIKDVLQRTNYFVVAGALTVAALLPVLSAQQTSALGLLDRKLMVSSTNASDDALAPDGSTYTFDGSHIVAGDGRNGTKVTHTYTFTVPSAGNIEGFTIEYCQTAFAYVGVGACAAPGGFTAAAWDGAVVTIDGVTFDVDDNSVANYLTFIDTTGMAVTAPEVVTITMTATETDFFANPNAAYGGTYFAHISTYGDSADATASFADGTGPIDGLKDEGTVTSNVTKSISIYTRVQETLNFSVEGDDAADGPGVLAANVWTTGACTPLTQSGTVNMGDSNHALDATQPYYGKSYFRLATNASGGTDVYYVGDTLRSGANTITPLGAAAVASAFGGEQFGLAFDNTSNGNTNEVRGGTGADLVSVAAYASNATGYAFVADVDTPTLLASASSVVQCDTGAVKYVANISTDTEAGIYTTKLNYIAASKY